MLSSVSLHIKAYGVLWTAALLVPSILLFGAKHARIAHRPPVPGLCPTWSNSGLLEKPIVHFKSSFDSKHVDDLD